MLKNMQMLLYTCFYNMSLNVLRTNIGKIRVNIGPYFSYFMSSCTNRFAVFYIFFSLICSQPRDKQNRDHDFFLFKYFLNNIFSTVLMQNTLSKLVELLKQKMNNSLLVKTRTQFCAVVCRKWLCKSLKLIFSAVFVLELVKCSQPRNHCLTKFF